MAEVLTTLYAPFQFFIEDENDASYIRQSLL